VLIADENIEAALILRDGLAQRGHLCEIASSSDKALIDIRKLVFDIAICNVQMGGQSKFELLEQIGLIQPSLPVIVGAAATSMQEAVAAARCGAFQYVQKPFDIEQLLDFIEQASKDSQRDQRATIPVSEPVRAVPSGGIVQASPSMRELVESIGLVARSSAAVLILGESGTGKERVARAIHAESSRAKQPFVAVNSSAIPEQLLESEVFGHVRGAFTGATQARRGLLAEAHGGTLLLDEIGDMPIALQPKLLRVLQFGETRPVGSDRTGHVDVRIIAATHRDLNLLVKEGRFREDLRYRLNVIPLVVPPLRERREDILPLVAQFLQEARERTATSPVDSINDEALSVLTQAEWPGNVRELENTIERLVVLGRESVVTPRELEFMGVRPQGKSWPTWPTNVGSLWTLKEMNNRYLDWLLIQTGGDKARAAAILNIDLSTLYRWERAKR
jgi:two-component system, NtrC family, response regulator HydG